MEYKHHVQKDTFEEVDSTDNSRSIFIGGIPLTSTYKQVLTYLETFDYVESLVLPRDRQSGQLKGYARAVLASEDGVDRVMNANHLHRIGHLTVGISRWRSQNDYLTQKDQQVGRKVYVKFPACLSQADLRDYFVKNFGSVVSIDVKTDPHTRRFRNFCYVVFEEESSASMVTQQNRHIIKKKTVLCEMSKPAHLVKKAQTDKSKSDNSRAPATIGEKPVDMSCQETFQTRNYVSKNLTLVTTKNTAKLSNMQAIEGSPKTPVTTRTGTSSQGSQKAFFGMGLNGLMESAIESKECSHRMIKNQLLLEHTSKKKSQVREGCSGSVHIKPTSKLYSQDSAASINSNHLILENVKFNLLTLRPLV